MVWCTNCGKKLEEHEKFCTSCGRKRVEIELGSSEEKTQETNIDIADEKIDESQEKIEAQIEQFSEKIGRFDENEVQLPQEQNLVRKYDMEKFTNNLYKRKTIDEIRKKKEGMEEEIDSLLEKIEHEVIPKSQANEELAKLKNKEKELQRLEEKNQKPEKFDFESDFAEKKKLETKISKIESLRSREEISDEAYKRSKIEYEEELGEIKNNMREHFVELNHLKVELEQKLVESNLELDALLIEYETEEIKQKEYLKLKEKQEKSIERYEYAFQYLKKILT